MAKNLIIKMENARILRGIIETLDFLVEETKIYFGKDGININAIDDSKVGMVIANLPSSMFSDYACKEDVNFGLTIRDVLKILKRAKATDTLELLQEKTDSIELWFRMSSGKSKRTFKLKTKTIDDGETEEEVDGKAVKVGSAIENILANIDPKLTTTISLDPIIMDDVVKDSLIISDIIKIIVSKKEKTLNFLAFDDSGEVEVEIDLSTVDEESGIYEISLKGDAQGIYALAYLENAIKIQSVSDTLKISIGEQVPVKIEATLKGENGDGSFIYLLAPRSDDDNDEDNAFDEDNDENVDKNFDEDMDE